MTMKAKRLWICQSQVLEAERTFSNLQTLVCRVGGKNSRTSAWLEQAAYSMNHRVGKNG